MKPFWVWVSQLICHISWFHTLFTKVVREEICFNQLRHSVVDDSHYHSAINHRNHALQSANDADRPDRDQTDKCWGSSTGRRSPGPDRKAISLFSILVNIVYCGRRRRRENKKRETAGRVKFPPSWGMEEGLLIHRTVAWNTSNLTCICHSQVARQLTCNSFF